LQDHRINALRQYLLLVRVPNLFTAPSNILVGYFATVPAAEANGLHLASLMVSSMLLYVAGVVLNDYFDIEADKRERPSRPLASGLVPKERAIVIATAALIAANAIALTVSLTSLAISAALSVALIAYDFRLKRGLMAPFSMGSTRFLNVILGASPMLFASSGVPVAFVAAALLFVYVVAIMMLSKREVGDEKPNAAGAIAIVSAVAVSLAMAGFLLQFQWAFLINLAIFSAVMVITFGRLERSSSQSVQKAVKNLVLSIIILDSAFVAGTAGLVYGLATMLFIVPALLLAKKLYVT
jgi:4-hydroxybenzoate polyprenyltransferase